MMPKQIDKLPATKLLLNLLAQTGKAVIDFIEFSNDIQNYQRMLMPGNLEQVREFKKFKEQLYLNKVLNNLKRTRYIQTHRLGNKLSITLNDKGKTELLANKLKCAERYANNSNTVVIFDIPEIKRSLRRQFRQLLRIGGFKRLQQSVWISELDNYELMVQFIRKHKIQPWVNVFVGNKFLHLPRR
ncbi:MAG: CRISPR-associated endonuclease Cas2 [Patescibacteria group bacterium]